MTASDIREKHRFMVKGLAKSAEAILTSLTPLKAHLQHMLIGLMDEIFEYNIAVTNTDKENTLEELGDRLFYSEGFGHHGLLEQFAQFKPVGLSRDETYQLLARTVKRHVFYEQELNIKDLAHAYFSLIDWIKYDASHLGLTIVDVQNHNMNKLWLGPNARYKDLQYTDTRAKERADKVDGDDTIGGDLNESLGIPACDSVTDGTCESCQ